MRNAADPLLARTAERCDDYESILSIQGYGISFANTPESESSPSCDLCMNWLGGGCKKFKIVAYEGGIIDNLEEIKCKN